MTHKTQLWKRVQRARAQARTTRLARLNLLGRNDPTLEAQARELAQAANDYECQAQEFADEIESLVEHIPAGIDWGDLTNYS